MICKEPWMNLAGDDLRYPKWLCPKAKEPPNLSQIVHFSREAGDFKAHHILETHLNRNLR